MHPVRIQVGQRSLVTGMLKRFRGLLINDTARPSPPPGLCLIHIGVWGQALRRPSVNLRRKRDGTGTGDQ